MRAVIILFSVVLPQTLGRFGTVAFLAAVYKVRPTDEMSREHFTYISYGYFRDFKQENGYYISKKIYARED
jgi:hypothetical protein